MGVGEQEAARPASGWSSGTAARARPCGR
jgi:hypothetical protein